jgi:hypothetical protein
MKVKDEGEVKVKIKIKRHIHDAGHQGVLYGA